MKGYAHEITDCLDLLGAEKSVIGSLILDNGSYDHISNTLTP